MATAVKLPASVNVHAVADANANADAKPDATADAAAHKPLSERVYSFEYLHAEGFEYLADNSHIKTGYRLHYTLRECLLSIFHLHNETFNIWTHLVGALIFIALVIYLALSNNLTGTAAPTSAGANPKQAAAANANLTTWCTLADPNATLLQAGRHTQPMLLAAFAPDRAIYIRTTPIPAATSRDAQAALALLRQLPTLDQVYARLGENVGNLSQGVVTQLVALQNELTLLRTTVSQVADGSSAQLATLVGGVVQRADNFSSLFDALNVGANRTVQYADRTVQYALKEFRGMVDNVLQRIGGSDHHVGEWPIFVFLASAIVCLSSSAIFHMMYVYSRPVYVFLSRLDYAGIALLIAGSFYPVIYYSFFCQPNIIKLYLTIITAMALFAFCFSLMPKFSTPRFIFIRTGMFLAIGFFALVPITHLVIQFGIFDPHVTVPIGLLILMGALYTFGAIIYATKFPERLSPGRFDVYFSSHQIWHVFVLAAALVHYVNAIQHYEWRWNTQCEGYP